MSEIMQHLRKVVLLRDGAGLTDGQLLECFLNRREEAAVAALVQRHGPMVWGVCRRLVPNHHDAEDAFQATFLVLVRRAATVRPREMVANWLYGVARQTALKARAVCARRRVREKQVIDMPDAIPKEPSGTHDLHPFLDQELSRLPDKYRIVLLLCDLEGKTRKEAAHQLRVPEGTIAGRLARARTMLAKRLTRRGQILSVGALAATLSQSAASACVPSALVSNTIKAASLSASGQAAAVSSSIAALTQGVLKSMLLAKLKLPLTLVLLAAIFWGLGTFLHKAPAAGRDQAQMAMTGTSSEGQTAEKEAGAGQQSPPVPAPAPATSPMMDLHKFLKAHLVLLHRLLHG
jgi:RNA polymerase sigma factor (sigma-70 family)